MMKNLNFVLAVLIMLSGSVIFAQKAEIDTEKSSVEWIGKKIGGEHNGNIQLKSGSLTLKEDRIVSGKFVVDMATITNTDLEDKEYNQKLVGHLKSDDFFGVEKFPTAEFVLTQSSKFEDGKANVKGDLTIKGKTETVLFKVMKEGNGYTTKMEIDRSKFDVRYGSNSFFDNLGDKAIDDIFILNVKIEVK